MSEIQVEVEHGNSLVIRIPCRVIGSLVKNPDNILLKKLTPQQKRVLHLIRKGRCNKEIASELNISVRTANWHIHDIYTRLGINCRQDIFKRWGMVP